MATSPDGAHRVACSDVAIIDNGVTIAEIFPVKMILDREHDNINIIN